MDLILLKRIAALVAAVFALIALLSATAVIGPVPAWMLPAAVLALVVAVAWP